MLVGWLGIRLMGSIWLWIAAVARDTLLLSLPSLALPCWQDFSEAKGGRRREVMDGWVDGEPDTGLSLLRINCFARVKRFQTAKTQAGAPLPSDGTQNRERRVKPQKARQFLVFNSNTSSCELTQAKMELTLHNETRWGEGLQSLNIDWKIEKLWKKSPKVFFHIKDHLLYWRLQGFVWWRRARGIEGGRICCVERTKWVKITIDYKLVRSCHVLSTQGYLSRK